MQACGLKGDTESWSQLIDIHVMGRMTTRDLEHGVIQMERRYKRKDNSGGSEISAQINQYVTGTVVWGSIRTKQDASETLSD